MKNRSGASGKVMRELRDNRLKNLHRVNQEETQRATEKKLK